MSKQKKIDKEFLFSDGSLNVYKYRLLSSGYQQNEFEKNPIGYYMHKRDDGVVVRWYDFRVEGDKLYAKPCINLSNQRGQQTVDEIESGFLNAASVGQIVALEISTDPNDYLPGQEGPTVSKWYNRELSLVDIPGNLNALTELVDANDNPINLSAATPNFLKMKQIVYSAANLALLNLKADADQPAVDSALADLVAKANKVPALESQVSNLTTEKDKAVKDLATFKKDTTGQQVKDLVATAVQEKRITVEAGNKLEKTYEGKPDELKELLAAMPAYKSITKDLKADTEGQKGKTWDEMDKAGELENLKASDFDAFKELYKKQFKTEYTGTK